MTYKRKLLSLLFIITSSASFAAELLIENVTLISPERMQPLEHAYIRIVDDKIIEVSTSPLVAGKGSIKINGTGQFLIPGLMDSHVHVSSMPG